MKLNTLSKFLLLAHRPEKGGFFINDIYLNHGIIGAALLEMTNDKKLILENDCLTAVEGQYMKESILSDILEQIDRPKKIGRLNIGFRNLRENLLNINGDF